MSFLDNLENNLKAMENLEQRDPEALARQEAKRKAERAEAEAKAPHVAALRNSPFTAELLKQARVIGHGQRVLVRFAWIGDTLRLDASPVKRMELEPTATGVEVVSFADGAEVSRRGIDLATASAGEVIRAWLIPL
jgi:hypothetical protein